MKHVAHVILVAALVVGCSQPLSTREKGALIGAGVGAGAGAAVGHSVGHTGAGALIGAGVGAVSGAVIGDAMQSREQAPPPVAVIAPPPALPPAPPQLVWVPAWGVYVVQGHDVVVHESAYYYFHAGRWWRSSSYAGPWAVVASPPRVVAHLPQGRLHAHMPRHCPPGQAKKGRC